MTDTYRLCNTLTFARRLAMYEAEDKLYKDLGFYHTGRMKKDHRGMEKPIIRHKPKG